MENICLIPARVGSKKVPNKNFKLFDGKPIIYHTIQKAIDANIFEKIIVAIDNVQMGEAIGRMFPNIVIYIRNEKNADDNAILFDLCTEVIDYFDLEGNLCILYTTAVFVKTKYFINAIDLLENDNFDCVFPVAKDSHYHEKALMKWDKQVEYKFPQYNRVPSQACQQLYHHTGLFFFCNIEKMLEKKNIITDNCGCIEISEMECQEIDTMEDWRLMEFKWRYMKVVK